MSKEARRGSGTGPGDGAGDGAGGNAATSVTSTPAPHAAASSVGTGAGAPGGPGGTGDAPIATMSPGASPLTRVQNQLKPKIVDLYTTVFQNTTSVSSLSTDFWNELFLLPCNPRALYAVIDSLSPEQLLGKRSITQAFFIKATTRLKSDSNPDNILRTLSTFLQAILAKQFINPSADLISVLAGLDKVDDAFFKLVDGLDYIVRTSQNLSTRVTAIRTITIAVGGSYQTSLAQYFINCPKDMFSSLMDFIHSPGTDLFIGDAFSLVGILASFDKFEAPNNPYRRRLADFVDDATMQRIAVSSTHVWKICLDQYLNANNGGGFSFLPDRPTSPKIGVQGLGFIASLLGWGGNHASERNGAESTAGSVTGSAAGSVAGSATASAAGSGPASTTASARPSLSTDPEIPHRTISLLLAVYEFIYANTVFCRQFINAPPAPKPPHQPGDPAVTSLSPEPPIVLYLRLCSWVFQCQNTSPRAILYGKLQLITLRLMVENAFPALVADGNKTTLLNLSYHRNPPLPPYNSRQQRRLVEGVLDCVQGYLRYNMKKADMDFSMYVLALQVLFQVVANLRATRSRLPYHWDELWKTLLSVVRFINSHLDKTSTHQQEACHLIALVLATVTIFGGSDGDSILSDQWHYHDLIYKLIASEKDLTELFAALPARSQPSASVLKAVLSHYKSKIADTTSSKDVIAIIKQASDSASPSQFAVARDDATRETSQLLLHEGLQRYREADERLYLKRLGRQVVHDAQGLYL